MGLSNTDIGFVSGTYFLGYLLATPILVGLTDRIDARLIFLGGCAFGTVGCLGFALLARDFWSAASCWTLVGAGLAGTDRTRAASSKRAFKICNPGI